MNKISNLWNAVQNVAVKPSVTMFYIRVRYWGAVGRFQMLTKLLDTKCWVKKLR